MASLDPAVDKLEDAVAKGKVAVAQAKIAAEKYKLRPEHWQKIDNAEAGAQKTLTMIDRIFPERLRGTGARLQSQFTLLTILAALFLVGSTIALWWFTKEKPEPSRRPTRRPVEEDDEYEYYEE